ncbi:hypothetical protein AKJ65_04105 [candidate division MSBL1 archaeon SCGC-AAA259E19]|uniref:Uncharacterized protein n=1 Tax=candidate division MSBL1 archaeon SCGC-AAA259E19 TaxID=1698264 RepID=A0A133UK12_9EURY|nr:hypothetical protein AKJ65_04105 [candidate division MSBL1 archaeon SCGC-AAA259E19]
MNWVREGFGRILPREDGKGRLRSLGIDSVDDYLAMVEALNDPINATGKMDENKFEKGPS